ncbi:MAG: PAS domain-containing protein [bacterium]
MESDLLFSEHPEKSDTGLRHLQSRYVIPYVVCVAIAVLVTGFVISFRSRALLVDRVKSEQLTAARAGAQGVGAFADTALRFAESVSDSSLAKSSDMTAVRVLIKSKVENTGPISELYLLGNNSKLLAASVEGGPMAAALIEDSCYEKVRSGEAQNCFTGLMRLDNGERRAYVYVPVFNSGASGVFRIVVVELNLEDKSFNSIVTGLNPGDKGFSYLVDQRGRLIASGDSSNENAVRDVSKLEPVRAVLKNTTGSIVYKYGRDNMLASFTTVEPMGWGFIAQRPAGEADDGFGLLFKLILLFLITAGGAAAALAMYQVQAVTRFLFFLSARMDAVARGHSHVEIVKGEASGFAPLATSFNKMVEAIEESRQDGTKALDNVRETARFNQGILSSIRDIFIVVDPWQAVVVANDKAESYMPAGMRPCVGKPLSTLGAAWGQTRLTEAVRKVFDSAHVVSVSAVRFPAVEGNDPAVFDFRIYPLSTGSGGAVFYGREVSEFVSRHEKMRESEAFYRAAATSSGDATLVLDQDNKVEWFNPAAGALLGVEDDFLGVDWPACMAEKSRGPFTCELKRSAEEETPFAAMEIEYARGDRRLALEAVAGLMLIGAGAAKTVVTLRRVDSLRGLERNALLEKPLLEKRIKFLMAVIEAAPDELAVVGEQGQVLMVNSAFARRFEEQQREVFIGKKFDILSAGGGPVIDPAQMDRLGSARRELMLRNLRGKTFQAEVHGAAIRSDNGGKGYVYSIREIGSERESQAREARKLEARTRTRMARTIADRFERILESLTAEVKELGGNIFAPETRAIWENILKSCKDLSLAANSLTMYSVDSPVQLSACSVEKIVKDTVDTLRGKGMIPESVQVDMQPDKFCQPLSADSDLLMMVVWHLTLNAIQAASLNEEGGEVLVRSYQADVEGAQTVLIEVFDNGPEYDPAETAHFFEPFYGTKPGSMGLGLTLCRRVVLKHGGRIGIERSKGITRASFFIPLELTRGNLPRV